MTTLTAGVEEGGFITSNYRTSGGCVKGTPVSIGGGPPVLPPMDYPAKPDVIDDNTVLRAPKREARDSCANSTATAAVSCGE